jgi:Holliday junction resolvase RusA-like endonuclease
MAKTVSFTVPGPPRRWMRPAQGVNPKTGRVMRFTDKKAEASKREIAQLARLAWKGPPACGPVTLRVIAVFRVPKSWPKAIHAAAREARVPHIADPDLDQLVKQVMDALVGIAFVDDNQVVSFTQSAKRYGSPDRTEVTIHVLGQEPDEITPGQRRIEKEQAKLGLMPAPSPSRFTAPQLFPPKTEKD